MGRYFLYRIHPLTVAEILGRKNLQQEIENSKQLAKDAWQHLFDFEDFPEPFALATQQFYQGWHKLRYDQFFYDDLRVLSKVIDISQIELLAQLLINQVTSTVKYSELAKKRVFPNQQFVIGSCFSIKPSSKNISRALITKPKVYLWAWLLVKVIGSKMENLVACHLLKAAQLWTDIGLGNYQLYYLRDKDKHEVDFLMTKITNHG